MSKSEAEARASLALAKAKAKMPALAAASRNVSYTDAKKIALKEGKPIFLSVRLDCKGLCQELRPQFITCHEASFEGSDRPRALLLQPDSNGNIWRVKEWGQLPNALQVRTAAAESKKTAVEPADPSLDLLMAMFVAGTIAVEPAEFTQAAPAGQAPSGFGWTCDGNGCRLVPVSPEAFGFAKMPPVAAAPQAAASGEAFAARFPRLARFRGRARGAMGLPPPRIAGGFVSFPALAAPSQAPAASTPTATPAATATSFVQIGNHRVDGALIDRARKAGLNWSTIFKIILTAGIEALKQILDDLGK